MIVKKLFKKRKIEKGLFEKCVGQDSTLPLDLRNRISKSQDIPKYIAYGDLGEEAQEPNGKWIVLGENYLWIKNDKGIHPYFFQEFDKVEKIQLGSIHKITLICKGEVVEKILYSSRQKVVFEQFCHLLGKKIQNPQFKAYFNLDPEKHYQET